MRLGRRYYHRPRSTIRFPYPPPPRSPATGRGNLQPLPPGVKQTLLTAGYSYDPRFSVICRLFETGGGQFKRFAPYPRLSAPASAPRGMGDHERLTESQFAIGVISRRPEARKILAVRVRVCGQPKGPPGTPPPAK